MKMKRLLSVLLALALLLAVLPGMAVAENQKPTYTTGIYMEAVDNAPSGDVMVAVQKPDGNGHNIPVFDLEYDSSAGFSLMRMLAKSQVKNLR